MEDHQQLIQQVKDLIMANRTDQALELLAKKQLSSLDKKLIILNSRYNKVKEDQILGVSDPDEARREINQINLAILNLSEKISKKPSTARTNVPSTTSPKRFDYKKVLIPGLIVIIIGFIAIQILAPDQEKRAWSTAQKGNSIELYTQYILVYPEGKYVAEANNLISQINNRKANNPIIKVVDVTVGDSDFDSISDNEYEVILEKAHFFLSANEDEQAEKIFTDLQKARPDAPELEQGLKLIKVRRVLTEGLESPSPEKYEPGKTYAKCKIPDVYDTFINNEGNTEKRMVRKGSWTDWAEVICPGSKTILDSSQIMKVQLALNKTGHFYGPFDSKMNNNLRIAITLFNAENKLGSNCLSANPTDCIMYPGNIIQRGILEKLGFKDKFLESIQVALNVQGYKIEVDGVYHKEDKEVILKYQQEHGLPLGKYSQQFLEKLGLPDKLKTGSELMPEIKGIELIQIALNKQGYNVEITGIIDAKTRETLTKYQRDNGLPAGNLNLETFKSLGINPENFRR